MLYPLPALLKETTICSSHKIKKFTSAEDVADIRMLVKKALDYKAAPLKDITRGQHRKIGLLFFNPSLRTRISTQVAARNLGMETIVFNADKEGWQLEFGEGAVMNGRTSEHIKDAAPVLGNYFDILCIRTFPSLTSREEDYSEHYLNAFIRYCGRPVISLESATLHPLQSLADLMTITEHTPDAAKPKIVLTWAPHVKPLPQCVANSFAQWINAWDGKGEFVITHPPQYALEETFTKGAVITHNQEEALKNADFVYIKNWSAYHDYGKIYEQKTSWMLSPEKLKHTNGASIMHCLPVRRNIELGDDLLDSSCSLVTQQAANRVWAAQAVISELL